MNYRLLSRKITKNVYNYQMVSLAHIFCSIKERNQGPFTGSHCQQR